jgi:hypothetical protein
MQTFLIAMFVKLAQNEQFREFVANQLERLLPKFVAAVAGLLPSFGGSILKTFMDRVPELPNLDDLPQAVSDVAQSIIDTVPDPDIPGLSNVFDASEMVKDVLRGFLR